MGEGRQSTGVATGFIKGFFGCFGALAAMLLIVVLLVFFLMWRAVSDEGAIRDGRATGVSTFVTHCAAGLSQKISTDLAWAGSSVVASGSYVSSAEPPQRIVCAIRRRDGSAASIEVVVHCPNALEPRCVSVG